MTEEQHLKRKTLLIQIYLVAAVVASAQTHLKLFG